MPVICSKRRTSGRSAPIPRTGERRDHYFQTGGHQRPVQRRHSQLLGRWSLLGILLPIVTIKYLDIQYWFSWSLRNRVDIRSHLVDAIVCATLSRCRCMATNHGLLDQNRCSIALLPESYRFWNHFLNIGDLALVGLRPFHRMLISSNKQYIQWIILHRN